MPMLSSSVNVDQLSADFTRLIGVSWYNNTKLQLDYDSGERAVFTREPIEKGTIIGKVPGIPTYVWDMTHSEYMFVDHDMVLDVGQLHPRPIITLIRNENDSWVETNCHLFLHNDQKTGDTEVYIYAIVDIPPGCELVYEISNGYR